MAVTAIVDNGQILETATQSSVKKAASKNGMDKDAFLQLLVAHDEISKNPLEPTSNTEYTAFDFNSTIHSNLKLYAFYELQTFTIRYYDKANLLLESTINFNQTAENKSAPVKEGFTFKGWSTSESEFIRYDFNTKVTKDTNLYAFYEITKLTITFIHEGNSTTSNTEYNTTISAIEPSSKEGYTFKGWSLKRMFLKLTIFQLL